MISNLLAIIYGIVIAVGVLLTIKYNNNNLKLTIRGKRLVAICAVIVGVMFAQVIIHVQVECDLRTNSSCEIRWI